MHVAGGTGLGPCLVLDGAVQRRVDHERRISPFIPFHLACYLRADDPLAQEPERELSGIYPRRHEPPEGYLLAALQPDSVALCEPRRIFSTPALVLISPPKERRWSARASDTWCIPPFTRLLPASCSTVPKSQASSAP